MVKKERVETIGGFSTYTIYSQIAGAAALTFTNILEVTKIRLIQDTIQCSETHYKRKLFTKQILEKMSQKQNSIIPKIQKKCLNCLPNRSGLLTLNHLIKSHGLFYVCTKGLAATINSSVIRIGFFFPAMDFFQTKIQRIKFFKERNQIYTTMSASGLSRFITTLISFPFEVSKIKKQSSSHNKLKMLEIMKIMKDNPRKFSGVFLTFFQRELFYTFSFWFNFDLIKMHFSKKYNKNQEDFAIKLPSAFLAGLISALMTFPFDLIQTNMILDPTQSANGPIKILKNLYTNYGISSLMNGLSVRIFRGGLSIVTFFTVYDSCKSWEKKYLLK